MLLINKGIDIAISYWNCFVSLNTHVEKWRLVLREIQVSTVSYFQFHYWYLLHEGSFGWSHILVKLVNDWLIGCFNQVNYITSWLVPRWLEIAFSQYLMTKEFLENWTSFIQLVTPRKITMLVYVTETYTITISFKNQFTCNKPIIKEIKSLLTVF